jgi:hypothetical protein
MTRSSFASTASATVAHGTVEARGVRDSEPEKKSTSR